MPKHQAPSQPHAPKKERNAEKAEQLLRCAAQERVRQEALICTIAGKVEITQNELRARNDLFTLFSTQRKQIEANAFVMVEKSAEQSNQSSRCVIQ